MIDQRVSNLLTGSAVPVEFVYQGKRYTPTSTSHWKTTLDGLKRLQPAARSQLGQQPVDAEYKGSGAQPDQNTGGEFAHAWVL